MFAQSAFLNSLPAWVLGLKRPLQISFGVALVTAAITLFMPNYYRSEARILPVESKGAGGLGGLASAAAAFGMAVPGGDSTDANSVDILNSRWMRESLLKSEFTFKQRTWRFGAEQTRTQTLYDYLEAKNMDRAIQEMGTVCSAFRDLKSKVLTLSAETLSPELSQQVVQRAARLLEAFVQEKGRTRGGYKAAFAEARLKEARGEMATAEEDFRKFLDGNRNYQISTEPSVRIRGARLEAELKLRQQLVMTLAMSREQALMDEKNDMPILNVLDAGNLPIDKSRPGRAAIVRLAFILSLASAWAWLNREWIKARLLDADRDDDASTVSKKEIS
ncbi:MAG: hypothetical protein Q8O19_00305 [Rectinemataceae bacterium]|nr:hypothetical protein [Rectinemataceae bacterium]